LSRRRRPSEPPEGDAPGHLRRDRTWAGLRRGDTVEITGTRVRRATWTFLAHVANSATGEEWVEVVGGGPGDRKLRSFPCDRVFAPRAKGKPLGPSLAEAPRLPLG
jgi:hypothetical protein